MFSEGRYGHGNGTQLPCIFMNLNAWIMECNLTSPLRIMCGRRRPTRQRIVARDYEMRVSQLRRLRARGRNGRVSLAPTADGHLRSPASQDRPAVPQRVAPPVPPARSSHLVSLSAASRSAAGKGQIGRYGEARNRSGCS